MSKKKQEKRVIKLVRKANELVEAKYKLDIWETRVFTQMLTMIRKDDEDFHTYKVYLKDVIRDFGLKSNNDAYSRLKGGAMKLMSKIVKVERKTEEGIMELHTPIVVGVENLVSPNSHVEDAKFIKISFHPEMRPYLLSLKSQFTTYDARNISKLPSSYSIRIYELLKQYQKIGQRKFALGELKEIIGVIEEIDINGKKTYKDNYPLYGNFKQRVLKKAQKDLAKNTDIRFEFEEIKKGRAVNEVLFTIYYNEPGRKSTEKKAAKNGSKNGSAPKAAENGQEFNKELYEELWNEVRGYDVTETTLKGWMATYASDVSHLKKCINYAVNRKKAGQQINTLGGYINVLLQNGELYDAKEEEKKEATAKKQRAEKREQLLAELQEKKKEIERSRHKEKTGLVRKILIENPLIQKQVFDKVKLKHSDKFDGSKTDMENYEIDGITIRTKVNILVFKQFQDLFTPVDEKYDLHIKAVKQEESKVQ